MSDQVLLPVFLKLEGRRVLLVGGGGVAAARLGELTRAGAHVTVVAPEIRPALLSFGGVIVLQREFVASDLDGESGGQVILPRDRTTIGGSILNN